MFVKAFFSLGKSTGPGIAEGRTRQGRAAPVEGKLLSGHEVSKGGKGPGAAGGSLAGQQVSGSRLAGQAAAGAGGVRCRRGGGGRPRGRRNASGSPHHRKTTQARPEALTTSSLPILCGILTQVGVPLTHRLPDLVPRRRGCWARPLQPVHHGSPAEDRAAPIPDCRPSVCSVNDSDYLRRESRPCSNGLDLDADQAHVSHPGHSGAPIWRVSLD
jgi:hypothetical protein